MPDHGLRVAIVGAGVGGIATALFLRDAGIEAVVYEQNAEITAAGAGIVVAPNAVRLIRRLGLAGPFVDRAVRLEWAWEFRRWANGEVLSVQEMGERCEARFGEAMYVAHRGDLIGLLADAVPAETLRLSSRVAGIRDEGDEVELTYVPGDGPPETARYDAVIGADGIHSGLRGLITETAVPEFSGDCAFRCLLPAEDVPEFFRRPAQTLWLGPGRHFVHYPVSAGKLVNVVAIVPAGDWRDESWVAEGRVADLAAEFLGWDDRIGTLIAAATETKRWALYDRSPLPRWTRGRLTLLGDSAHAMLPYYGQGANQAIEDAVVLAMALGGASPAEVPEALLRYEEIRRPRASRVQEMSHGRRETNHLPDGPEQRARDAAFAGQHPLEANAWLYAYDAEAEARKALGG